VVGGDAAELTALGATHVLDRHGGRDAVLGRVRAVVGDDDLTLAYDVIGVPADQALALSALSSRRRGALARLKPMGPVDAALVAGEKHAGYDVRDVFGMSALQPQVAGPFWEHLPEYLESGQLKATAYVTVEGLDAARANEVLDGYRDGKKVVQTHFHL
jgi:NADPH:quinone reductase